MAIDPATLKSRTIRECILRTLSVADRAGVTVGFSETQIFDGFRASVLRYQVEEVRPELTDLVQDKLAEEFADPTEPEGSGLVRYRLTSRGRDFVRGAFPWGRIDEFTGSQGIL